VLRLAMAEHPWRWLVRHFYLVLMAVIPVLRPVMLIRMLDRQTVKRFQGRVAAYVLAATVLIVFCAAVAELNAERGHQGANIEAFGDAIWWAMTTVSTVGYGDRYPVTTGGRLVAILLMVCGVALIGVVTGSVASWLVDRVRAPSDSTVRPVPAQADTSALLSEITDLRAEVARLRSELNPRQETSERTSPA
jgi:voltage-gated potassium channel